MEYIFTKKAAKPLGHYSQAVSHDGIIYVSGQLPVLPNGEFETGNVKKQTRLALEGLLAILKEAHSDKSKVLKTTIYITDISIWSDVNEEYADFFGSHKPARSAVPVKALPKGVSIEIEAIAFQ
jgi:2-iminobutanoate/2-iminopropanoate deaminase